MARPPKPIDESTYSGRFASRLRTLREKTGMTGYHVAELLSNNGFQCGERTYYGWESGRADPPLNALPFIAATLGVSIRTLFPAK